MGLFSSSRKISFNDLDDILRDIPGLKPSEREYVRGLFSRYRSNGISKREIVLGIRQLKREGSDFIGRNEAERIEEALLEFLNREE